ncbi:MAG: HlyD family type I secretion periplasmic adaptor subunit [Methyloceanibacter sp.]|nr:HlyD family type I secretion periplasmic adaptor subunit [Methyloceanibacter sp.]
MTEDAKDVVVRAPGLDVTPNPGPKLNLGSLPGPDVAPEDIVRRGLGLYQLVGFGLVVLLVFGLGAWAAIAEIKGAVIAPATVVVESTSKKVQHVEGGIVSEILVKEGQRVKAGQLLLRLDQVEVLAELAIVEARLNELEAAQARLKAERDQVDDIRFPDGLKSRAGDNDDVQSILDGQVKLFTARASEKKGKKEQLGQRILQLKEEIGGLTAQRNAKEKQEELITAELEGLSLLREKKLIPVSRLLEMQREQARLLGERGSLVAEIARAHGKIAETKLEIILVDQEARTETLTELRQAEAELTEYQERRTAARTRLKRTEIFSPRAGLVHQMTVHTIGGVITAGEPVMLIVPEQDKLVLEARVSPASIDQIRLDQVAAVRFGAFDQGTTPEIDGQVIRVSADITLPEAEANQEPYYKVRLGLAKQQLDRLDGLALKPGMPATAFIQTGGRTVISYLLKPLSDQIARTFRER